MPACLPIAVSLNTHDLIFPDKIWNVRIATTKLARPQNTVSAAVGQFHPGQYLLEESGVIAPVTPAPASTPVRNAGRQRFSKLGDRFIAFVLDTALLFGLFAVVDAWVFMRWGWVEGSELQLTAAAVLIAITLNTTILFLYGWFLEAGWGADAWESGGGNSSREQPRGAALVSAFAVRNW